MEFVDVRWIGDLRREFIDRAVHELVDRNEEEERKLRTGEQSVVETRKCLMMKRH